MPNDDYCVNPLPYHKAQDCSYGQYDHDHSYRDVLPHIWGNSVRGSGVDEFWVTEPIKVGFGRQINLDRRLMDSMAEELVKEVAVVLNG